jgi:catechol 2,3-dioxygenase-like lactoylglutathione lyase family enzyme
MEKFVAELMGALDGGLLSRRQFCERVALAATVYAAGEGAANAAPARGFRIIGINHISYACPDYRKARDFYASVLGMEIVPSADNGRETRLMFGPGPGRGGSFLIPRNGRTAPNAKAVVDHIAYTIGGGDKAQIHAALEAKGLVPAERGESLQFDDPFNFGVQIEVPISSRVANGTAAGPRQRVLLVNHISYSCPDFKRAADWYSMIFNLDQVGASASEVTLPFGQKGEHPLGVTDKDVPLPHLVIRNASVQDGQARRASKALVNHIAYTIADFDKERVRAELKRLGYPKPLPDGAHSFHIVDPNGFDVQISGIQMPALGG